jgi:hypothetical protein
MELGGRPILHLDVTAHLSAEWRCSSSVRRWRKNIRGASAQSKRILKAPSGNDPTGVPGLPDSIWGAASEMAPDILARLLQSR